MKLTKQNFISSGWQDTTQLDEIYQYALELIEQKNISTHKYLFKHLKRSLPDAHASLRMRDIPAPLTLAIEAKGTDAGKNLAIAKRQITELLRCPVVRSAPLCPMPALLAVLLHPCL